MKAPAAIVMVSVLVTWLVIAFLHPSAPSRPPASFAPQVAPPPGVDHGGAIWNVRSRVTADTVVNSQELVTADSNPKMTETGAKAIINRPEFRSTRWIVTISEESAEFLGQDSELD